LGKRELRPKPFEVKFLMDHCLGGAMEDGLVFVDDFPEGLVKLTGVDVFAAVLEIAEESAGLGEGDAGAFRRSTSAESVFLYTRIWRSTL